MLVQVQCPDCRAEFGVAEADLGRPGRCLKCGREVSLLATRDSDAPPASDTGPVWTPRRPSELAAGATFGRYRIVRRLGRGGMGTVYLAHDTQLQRDVALKVPRFAADESPEVVHRFYREARALAKFDHPNICPVYDVGQVDGVLFLTMLYIEGQSLSDLVTEPPLPQRKAAEVVRTLARALAEAHARGIVHRDLKPANVLISARRELVIMDFGLARRVEASDSRLTQAGSILGTPAYMPPEQIRGDIAAMGPGCDIYALGVILYELVAGRLPFEGPASVVMGLVMVMEPPRPSAFRPDLDPKLESICRRAMAKAIPDRFPTMTALAEALDEYLRASVPPVPTPDPKPRPPRRRWPGLAAAGLAALGLMGVIIQVRTDTGTVRIDVKDPSVVVRVDGRKIEVEALGEPLTLRIGEHYLQVTCNNLVVETRQFEVRRHDETVLEVTFAPAKPDEPEKPAVVQGESPPAPEKTADTPAPSPPAPVASEPPKAGPGMVKAGPPSAPETTEVPPSPSPGELAKVERGPSSKPATPSPAPVPPAKELTNTLGMTLVLIPAGEFSMGSPDSDPGAETDEQPQHRVRITRPFYLGATEVTVGQFRRFVEAANYRTEAELDGKGGAGWVEQKATFARDPKYTWRSPGFAQTDEHPVVNVSWNDAAAFCEWLGRQEGQTYRLPTEAEWEYACRAETTTRYACGDDAEMLATVANVADATGKATFPHWTSAIAARDGYVFTAPAGRFRANNFGLYDMHGNVWEWCSDEYAADSYRQSPAADPAGSLQVWYRVMRGGGWVYHPRDTRSASRSRLAPRDLNGYLGFRVVRVQPGK